MSAKQETVTDYTFGALKVRVNGLGVYTGGNHLQSACDKLSLDELRVANREAWKQKRQASRQAGRVTNASVHGCAPNDRACQHYDVAGVVCRETWKRIIKKGGRTV